MKRFLSIFIMFLISASSVLLVGCDMQQTPSTDSILQEKTEQVLAEGTREVGIPAIINFTELKQLKWIYELCDQENLICYAYLCNELNGEVGQYLGECIGYGIPYSTQFSNPEKTIQKRAYGKGWENIVVPQAEPNGLFKPTGLSATWLIMIDPVSKEPRPLYVEPSIIVSPYKLHKYE